MSKQRWDLGNTIRTWYCQDSSSSKFVTTLFHFQDVLEKTPATVSPTPSRTLPLCHASLSVGVETRPDRPDQGRRVWRCATAGHGDAGDLQASSTLQNSRAVFIRKSQKEISTRRRWGLQVATVAKREANARSVRWHVWNGQTVESLREESQTQERWRLDKRADARDIKNGH